MSTTGLDARLFLLIGHIYDVTWKSEGAEIQSLSAVNSANKESKFTIRRESVFMITDVIILESIYLARESPRHNRRLVKM
jgi:hypothetical protein